MISVTKINVFVFLNTIYLAGPSFALCALASVDVAIAPFVKHACLVAVSVHRAVGVKRASCEALLVSSVSLALLFGSEQRTTKSGSACALLFDSVHFGGSFCHTNELASFDTLVKNHHVLMERIIVVGVRRVLQSDRSFGVIINT